MATFYLDFENGNNANTGADWANAWKTINGGATAARIAPGDVIRIAKTGDPTSIGNATWTSKSDTVTLATAQTATIYLDGAWTAANSATSTTTTNRKQGSNAASITTAATTATNTKYAYLTVGGASGLDLSAYNAITFWIRNGTAIVANNFQIKLCSDTLGDTAVDTFDVTAIPSTTEWTPLTLTRVGGGNLGNAIKSIALYTGSVNPGNSRNLFIDNVSACTDTGLSLTSLISKNSLAFGGTETWHVLASINGTTVLLGQRNATTADAGAELRGYFTTGTSPATVTTYIRPTFKFAMQTSSSGSSQPIQDSGTAGNLITFSGGWNTTNNTQDGVTWIDGHNGIGIGIDISAPRNYIKIERLYACRFSVGFNSPTSGNSTGSIIETMAVGCNIGMYAGIFQGKIVATINNSGGQGLVHAGTGSYNYYDVKVLNNQDATVNNISAKNFLYNNNRLVLTINGNNFIEYFELIDNFNASSANLSLGVAQTLYVEEAVIQNNTATDTIVGSALLQINKLTASGNTNVGNYNGVIKVNQTNAASTQLIGSANSNARKSVNYPSNMYGSVNNVITDNRSYWAYGNSLSQTTTRHTASGVAWQINITNTAQTSELPIYFPIAKVACNASSLVTVKAWVKLSHATDIGAKLMIQANEIAGVTADVTAAKSADTNWEELTITFTPTVAGVAQIYVQGYWLANLADESIFVDDITVTQS